jgi:hypothetical protein
MARDTYTIIEDQPAIDRFDVEIRTFATYEAAKRYFDRHYTAAERNGESEMCIPRIDLNADREPHQ